MIYRWEPDAESHDEDGCMLMRPDDDSPGQDTFVAMYWYWRGEWQWVSSKHGPEGEEATAEKARQACELAVLHEAQP